MSETKNLRLFKHNEPLETNENKFDIDLALNQNWDKIEEFAGMVNDKVIELEDKDEEQDFNLQELQNEIKKDRENMINLETEGQSIHIEDSSDLEGQLEVLGNMEQDVREGYNLYDYMSKAISTTKGLTVTKDTENGYLIVNGTPEVSYLSVCNSMEITDILKDKATYTLWQEKYDNKLYLQVVGTKKDGTGNTNFFSASQKTAFTVDKSKYSRYAINIQIGLTTQAGTFNNYKNRYMLYEGTEEKPYEPYGASPSPEYPSTVRAVGDNINLLENTAKTQIINGVEFTVNPDKTIKINGTATENISTDITKNFAITEQSIFSGMCDGYGYNKMLIQIQGTDYNVNIPNSTLQVLQPKDNVKVRIYIYAGTSINNAIIRPKIEKGTVATSYSNFGQGSVEIKKTTANYYNVEDYNGNLNSHITIDENNWITASGKNTEESVTYLNHFTNNLDLIVGKKYWIVAEIKSVSGEGNFNITSASKGSGQFNGRAMQLTDLKIGQKVIFQETAINSAGQGLRTFISLQPGQTCNITFRLSVLETDPNKSNWKYVPYKKETYVLPIQKPMLEGDYFVKEADGWKEVHTWKKIILTGQENTWQLYTSGVRRFGLDLTKDLPKKETGKYATGYCTHFKVDTKMTTDLTMFLQVELRHFYVGIIDQNSKWVDVNTLKSELQRLYNAGTPVILYYKLETPSKLPCTPEQTEILDELDNFQTYKPVTNVTTDSIAKLKLKYIADTKTYVDNKVGNLEKQVNTINQLLSTTKTSSILLDNLQTDIESEVL